MTKPEDAKPTLPEQEATAAAPRFGRWALGWAKSIAVALAVWFLLSTFLVQAFHIPSGSMERTLLIGDVLFVNKTLYGAEVPLIHKHLPAFREPRHDEIVVVKSPIEDLLLIKRLVGLPGDTLAMKDGHLIRNGQRLPEPNVTLADPPPETDADTKARIRSWQLPFLIDTDSATYHPDLHNWGPLVVPAGRLLTLGDNRDESFDGRYYGFTPRDNLRGGPLFIYFSYDPSSYKPLPFLTAIRWNRLFTHPR